MEGGKLQDSPRRATTNISIYKGTRVREASITSHW